MNKRIFHVLPTREVNRRATTPQAINLLTPIKYFSGKIFTYGTYRNIYKLTSKTFKIQR